MVVKKLAGLVAVLMGLSLLAGCGSSESNNAALKDKKEIKIGISQLVEHPALDSAREGFLAALKDKGYEEGKNLKVDFQNAQNQQSTANTIAANFVSNKVDMILAIATPSAQAAVNKTNKIPILITAVTDPVGAGLAQSLESSGNNVTGTSDDVPIDKQFDLLKKLIPNAKKVGVVYNTAEKNSQVQVASAKKAAPDFGFEIIEIGVTGTNDVAQAVTNALDKVDVIYVPTDNTVASAMPLLVEKCYSKNIPIIASEAGMVKNGAVATSGIDYYKLGYETGLKAVEIINGKEPKDIPITLLEDLQLVINTDAVEKLKIDVPSDILDKAEKVTGGVK